jgi:hypothetical protein
MARVLIIEAKTCKSCCYLNKITEDSFACHITDETVLLNSKCSIGDDKQDYDNEVCAPLTRAYEDLECERDSFYVECQDLRERIVELESEVEALQNEKLELEASLAIETEIRR